MAIINFPSNIISDSDSKISFEPSIIGEVSRNNIDKKNINENKKKATKNNSKGIKNNSNCRQNKKQKAIEKESYPISGVVYLDINNDNVKDKGDIYLENIQVELYTYDNLKKPFRIQLTDSNGYYEFKDIELNKYYIRIKVPNGYGLLEKGEYSNISPKTLISDRIYNNKEGINIIVGLRKLFKILGVVFWDYNRNCSYENVDSGINNIIMKIYNEKNKLIDLTVTGKNKFFNGYFEFDNLAPGRYRIEFECIEGLKVCKPRKTYYGSKANPISNSIKINLKNKDIETAFVGFYRPKNISNKSY